MPASRAKKRAAKPAKVERKLTREELAAELDVHQETIGRYDRDGAPHERRGRSNFYDPAEYHAWMRANSKSGEDGRPRAKSSPDLDAARLRKENALAAKYEMDVGERERALVPVADVKRWIGERVGATKNKLIGLGAAVTPQLEGLDAAERQAVIDGRVREILEELAAA
jgi:phage terminase Nu1 subunit (DNA packaging protein)